MSKLFDQLKRAFAGFGRDRISQLSASVAYYGFLSVFPLLLVLVSLLGFALAAGLPFAVNAQDAVLAAVRSSLSGNNDISKLVDENIQAVIKARGTVGGIGLVTLLMSASGIFSQLRTAFDIIWNVGELKQSLVEKIKSNLVPIVVVVLLAPLMLLSTVINSVLNFVVKNTSFLPGSGFLWTFLTPLISAAVIVVAFAALYRFFPQTDVQWKDVWPGAILAGVVWEFGKQLLVWYVSRGQTAVYGTLGGVISFLLFLYYSGLILFFGAEWAAVRTRERKGEPEPVVSKAELNTAKAQDKLQKAQDKEKPAPARKSRIKPGQAFVGGAITAVIAIVGALALAAHRFLRSNNFS